MKRRLFAIHALMMAGLLGLAVPAHAQMAIQGVVVEQGQGGVERLRFATAAPIAPSKIFTLANPDRVVIDLPHASATGIILPPGYQGRLLRAIRFGQFDAMTSRVVLDLNGPARLVGHVTMPAPNGVGHQLVIDIAPTGPLNAAPMAAPVPPAAAPAIIPQQQKPLIIIDAGHGGQDPGAMGLHKTREKGVTLTFAQALKNGLLRTGRYRVALTREDDRFIMLPERVNIARKLKADIFISLHADSNPRPEARGLSVYTLSETASDEEAAALADRENKADIITGLDLGTADADVASILIDLAQRETMNKSAELADQVVASVHPKVQLLPNPHRFAGFRVLKAPDIPSILIELGFLSNNADEKLLQSPEYQSLVVGSITRALDAYIAEHGV